MPYPDETGNGPSDESFAGSQELEAALSTVTAVGVVFLLATLWTLLPKGVKTPATPRQVFDFT